MVQVDVGALNFIVGVVIPMLVALLTKANASRGVKAVANLFLSAVAGGVVVAIQQSGNIKVSTVVVGIGMTWVVSIASYYGLTKPSGAAPAIHNATANFGIGSSTPTEINPV